MVKDKSFLNFIYFYSNLFVYIYIYFFLTTVAGFLPSCTSVDTQWFITGALI